MFQRATAAYLGPGSSVPWPAARQQPLTVHGSIEAPGRNSPFCGQKKGSSRITGESGFDFHEEEAAVPVAVGHALDHL
ncbi:hypothetical protein, partial [Pseudomonas sp. PIC25]|uniref:hypothetical protein n=1 Tax=Pseudomonas sp. PIC25 TaxID=1958773 RepID=UPI001C4918B2